MESGAISSAIDRELDKSVRYCTVRVDLGENSYDIAIGRNLPLGLLIRGALPKAHDILVVTNDVVAPLYLEKTVNSLSQQNYNVRTCILKDGEQYKNVDSYMQIMTALIENNFGRDCALLALGGGVVGDMTGFAAATYQRGVDFVQVPTTLLSLVDSSVGGKTAINHKAGKNMIGAFYQPKFVVADLDYLHTLPERQIAAGMAEVIKYGICFDKDFFDYIASHDYQTIDYSYLVKRCCELKAEIVQLDSSEKGKRALLNFGHTFGHAIEVGSGYGSYLHGEAVAIGISMASYVAYKHMDMPESEFKAVTDCLIKYDLAIQTPKCMTSDDFMVLMHRDKKVKQGHITYILPSKIGKCFIVRYLDDATIKARIDEYNELLGQA